MEKKILLKKANQIFNLKTDETIFRHLSSIWNIT